MEFDDQEVTIHNESTKRDHTESGDSADKKPSKKRRSSLATTRRSIIGELISYDRGSSPSTHQEIVAGALSNEELPQTQQVKSLKPNPANVHLDEIIGKFHTKTKALDQEYAQWKEALRIWNEQQAHSKLLSESISPITEEDIPHDIQTVAHKDYITCQMMDYVGVEKTIEQQLERLYLNMSSCMKDFHLFRETVDGIKCSNQLIKSQLCSRMSPCNEPDLKENQYGPGNSRNNVKYHIENLISGE